MERDIIYTFDKKDFISGSIFGEIQSGFNMSFTIDGTKDSMKVNVWSFNENEILPYTVILHKKTNTWWVAASDKVSRYLNEDGFIYLHELELLGAIELLNARDLTDCGFNNNTYTIGDFIQRLFWLSSFELRRSIVIDLDNTISSKKVEYIKTFENYTLLSALREFLDGYNMCAKLVFDTDNDETNPLIIGANLKIMQRTGDYSLTSHNINTFDDVRESKTISKDSYGTSVISNAENVVSSVSKTYPSLGTIRTSGTEYRILAQNGVIRLPSKVFKANWLKLCLQIPQVRVEIKIGDYEGVVDNGEAIVNFSVNPYNINSYARSFNILNYLVSTVSTQQSLPNFYTNYAMAVSNKQDEILDFFKKAATITLYNGNELNPVTGAIVKGADVPYIPNVTYNAKFISGNHPTLPLIFCDKEMKNMLDKPWQAICWERGSNLISGFNAFETEQGGQGSITGFTPNECDLQGQTSYIIYADGNGNYVSLTQLSGSSTVHFRDTQWIINYIPMTDIKLKVDNDRDNNDVQLYNQNGRLTDCVALSKVINSYSKEISSDTITRYKTYYSFDDVPKIGSIVRKGSEDYVINNISFDFSQNENYGYFIECEITMSKYISLKSLMVNPNTNIRDYGIPQNYNVKRKQLYRDYYELDFTNSGDEDYYLTPSRIFDFYNTEPFEYTVIMALHYARPINNSYYYFYQLDTINYYMDKMVVIVCDFNDNNIIGYTNQNVWSGFDITRVFSGQIDSLNTPISYTDEKGEFEDIHLCFENNDQLTTVYYNYQMSQTGGSSYTGSLYNYSPFIPEEIYNAVAYSNHDISISENDYHKDSLEVPVFEYICQMGDNENVIIGENFLTRHPNTITFYSFKTDTDLTINNATTTISVNRNNDVLSINNSAYISYEIPLPGSQIQYRHIDITFFLGTTYDIEDGTWSNGTIVNVPSNNIDIAIFRHSYNIDTNEEIVELMFIVKNVTSDKLVSNTNLILAINHTKLN